MRISRLLLWLIYLHAIVVVFVATFDINVRGQDAIVDTVGIGLALCFLGVLAWVLHTIDRRTAAVELMLVVICLPFICSRFIVLMIAPAHFCFPWVQPSPQDTRNVFAFLSPAVVLFVLGLRAGGRAMRGASARASGPMPDVGASMWRVVGAFGVEAAIVIWMYLRLGIGSTVITETSESGGLLFLRHAVDPLSILAIGAAAALDRWGTLRRAERSLLWVLCIGFIALVAVSGSRSGFVSLGLIVLIYLATRQGDFSVPGGLLVFGSLALLASVILFPASTAIRVAWSEGTPNLSGVVGEGRTATSDVVTGRNLSEAINVSLDRVAGLDPLLMILGHHESSENTAAVSVGQNVESAINNVFPSALIGRKPFPGVLPSSRLFGLIYRSWTLKWIEQYYQTDMWTMWGISYALFGWVGGLIVNLIMGFGIGLGYARLQGVPTVAGRLLTMWALFSVYHLFVSFGLDVTFAISVYTLVGGLTAVALIQPRALPRGRDGIWPSGFDVAGAAWIPLHE